MITRQTFKAGWLPDTPDWRDHDYKLHMPGPLLPKVDLREYAPEVYDQGDIGSCTAQALCGCYHYNELKTSHPNTFKPSAMFVYYNERVILGTVDVDSGAMLRDGIKSMAKQGVCREEMWPYNPEFLWPKPTDTAYAFAATEVVTKYERIPQSLTFMRDCLCHGHPFVFGTMLYDNFFEVGSDGVVGMPRPGDKDCGGHAMACFGFDHERRMFLVRNSWGSGWGENGYCWMPYDYLTTSGLSEDFWTIQAVR